MQFRDQLLDFQHRRTCYALNKRIGLPYSLIVAFSRLRRQASGCRQRHASGRKFLAQQIADFSVDFDRFRWSVFGRPPDSDETHALPPSLEPLRTISASLRVDDAGE